MYTAYMNADIQSIAFLIASIPTSRNDNVHPVRISTNVNMMKNVNEERSAAFDVFDAILWVLTIMDIISLMPQ